MWYEHRSRETGTLYFNTSLWLSRYQSPRIPHAPFLPHCHSVQSRQLACHFQHSQVWLTKGPHGSRKLDSSLLCLSISTQGQNQGCWGFVGSTSRAEFRHNRGVCPEGSSQALPENPPAHQGSDIKHQHTWWEEGSKRQRDMNRQWFFNSVSEGDLSATCSESLFSHRSWEGPCRAQTQGRATHAFMAAGDGRYYCGWRMG